MAKSILDPKKLATSFRLRLLELRNILPGKDECFYEFAGRLADYSDINPNNFFKYFKELSGECVAHCGCLMVIDKLIDKFPCQCDYIEEQASEIIRVCTFEQDKLSFQ